MAHLKKFSMPPLGLKMPPPLGFAKGGHWPILGAKSVKYPSQNPTKKLTHLVDLLGHLLSRNCVSIFSDLGPP